MNKFITFAFIILFARSAYAIDTLCISIDMSIPIEQGWLDVDNEIVGIRGDQRPLSWGTTFQAQCFDGSTNYDVKIPFEQIKDSLMLSFKVKVDGTDNPDDGWQKGQNQQVTVYHGKKNVVNLKWESEPPPPEPTITGNVQIIGDFDSSPLKDDRNLYVYLPPDYDDSTRRYPVLYMHDGQNIFDASSVGQEWDVDEAAEKLIKSGEIEPMIIVGIANTQYRIDEYTPTKQTWNHELKRSIKSSDLTGEWLTEEGKTVRFQEVDDEFEVQIPGSDFWQSLILQDDKTYYLPQAGITFRINRDHEDNITSINADKPSMGGDGDLYGEFIINKVKPFIDKNYRTKPEKQFTALGGSSLGGLISMYLGVKYADTFGHLLVVSPSVWWDDRFIIKYVENLPAPTNQRIWMDMGTAEYDGAVTSLNDLRDALIVKGWQESDIDLRIYENAAHNERAWAKRMPDMLRFLFH